MSTWVRIVGIMVCLASGNVASATTWHVCAAGDRSCARFPNVQPTIQSAVNAAQPGDEVRIHPGTFIENVAVDKPLTLRGAGEERTTIVPGFSAPAPCDDASVCPSGSSSNVILIHSSGVSISSLTIDGDNPQLTSGVNVGGADVDARNGIIDDRNTGAVYGDLHVSHVTVKNVYLRGIQAGTGGTGIIIDHCTVRNVAAYWGSKAIAVISGAGEVVRNRTEDCFEGIAVAMTQGVRILDNFVTRSVFGMETDWTGASGAAPDLLEGNVVTDCVQDSWGIGVFEPSLPATVRGNHVENCLFALSVWGGAPPGAPSELAGNTAVGSSAPGSMGILVTSDTGGGGFWDVAASLSDNRVYDFESGVVVRSNGVNATVTLAGGVIAENAVGVDSDGALALESACLCGNDTSLLVQGSGTLAVHQNAIVRSGSWAVENLSTQPVDATRNWWGSRRGPDPQSIQGEVAIQPVLPYPVACGRW